MKIIDITILTNMDGLLRYADKNQNKYSCMIHLTDGYIPIPTINTKLPVLIIITSGGADPKDLDMKGHGLNYKVIKMTKE